MSVIDEALKANEEYAKSHNPLHQSPVPKRRLAVLTCMDTRLSYASLGLKQGDAHFIRNAGGIVTEDTLRSLLVSHFLLQTEEVMLVNHTDCGLMKTTEEDLRTNIERRTGTAVVSPERFYAFNNVEKNVRYQLQKLKTHPWVTKELNVRGFVYDVETGRLKEVVE